MTALTDCLDQKVKMHTELGERDSELASSRAASAALLAILLEYQRKHDEAAGGKGMCPCVLCKKVDEVMGKI